MSAYGADEAGRLEAALERIARAAARNGELHQLGDVAVGDPAPASTASGAVDVKALAARLDALIEELRGVLGQA